MADREKKRGRQKYKNLNILKGYPLVKNKNLIKNNGHKL